jgi:hypothetical protein
MDVFRGTTACNRDMVFAIRGEGNNPTLTQGAAMRLTIVPLIQAQALGLPSAFADANAIDRLQQLDEVIAVGSTQSEVERMPIGVNDQVAFQPFNAVLS